MNKIELIQIFIGILGLMGSWKLSQWWLIVVISILILCIPIFSFFKYKKEKRILSISSEKLKNLFRDVSTQYEPLSNTLIEIKQLINICKNLDNVSSGSWLGYHSSIYYKDFQYPPKNTFFSPEWGLRDPDRIISEHGSIGEWKKYNEDEVDTKISKQLGNTNFLKTVLEIEDLNQSLQYKSLKSRFLSIISLVRKNTFLEEQYKKIKEISTSPVEDYVNEYNRSSRVSRDSLAVYQGIQIPRHIEYLAKALHYKAYIHNFQVLKVTIEETYNHINQKVNL